MSEDGVGIGEEVGNGCGGKDMGFDGAQGHSLEI